MPRFLLGWLLGLGGTAIGLLLAVLILPQDQFTFDTPDGSNVVGFFVSLIIYAILSGLFTWMVLKFLVRNAGSIIALSGLFATFRLKFDQTSLRGLGL